MNVYKNPTIKYFINDLLKTNFLNKLIDLNLKRLNIKVLNYPNIMINFYFLIILILIFDVLNPMKINK